MGKNGKMGLQWVQSAVNCGSLGGVGKRGQKRPAVENRGKRDAVRKEGSISKFWEIRGGIWKKWAIKAAV